MNSSKTSAFLIAAACILGLAGPGVIAAQAPLETSFTYQGLLKHSNLPAIGTFDLVFKLYNGPDPLSDIQIGPTVTKLDVAVDEGLFAVELDFGEVFTGDALWLEVGVREAGSGAVTFLFPLQPVTASPHSIFATNADKVDGKNSADFLSVNGGSIVGNVDISGELQVSSTVDADSYTGDGSALTGIETVPSGLIAMWSGSIDSIPDGWVLCDGANGTPNLLDRFIKGVPNSMTDPGSTGGSSTHSHGGGNLSAPAHNHGGVSADANGSDIHFDDNSGGTDFDEPAQRSHTHNISQEPSMSILGDTAAASSEPEYFTLAFIMKL